MDDRKYKVKEIKLKKIETEDFKKMTQGINKKLDVVKGPFKRLFAPFKNQLIFVQDELKDLSQMENIPKSNTKDFTSRISYALALGLKEKEIFFFGILQWVAVMMGYLLWVQMLYWIPQPVWDSIGQCMDDPGNNDGCSAPADIILSLWGLVCILLVAFPLGILSTAMGTSHFLQKNGEESTVIKCLNTALSNAWATWYFHFIDGYITVNQIIQRLPQENNYETQAQVMARRAASEAAYFAWKVGIAGVIPSMVLGNGVIASGKNSIKFVKGNFLEIVKLRAAYASICWIVGILAYLGGILTVIYMGNGAYAPSGGLAIAKIYLYLVAPMALAISIVMILLRPIYILTLCDMYSDFLESRSEEAELSHDPSKGKKAVITFVILCVLVAGVAGFREEIGLTNRLSMEYPNYQDDRFTRLENGMYIEYDPNITGYYQCLQADGGLKLSEVSFAEYAKKLETYCKKKFRPYSTEN